MKLNLGCGQHTLDGYINIDLYETYSKQGHPIIKMDASDLEYDDNSIDEIYSRDLLEHIKWDMVSYTLKEWHRALEPGGKLFIDTPDILLVIDELKQSSHINMEDEHYRYLMTLLYGNNDKLGHDHKSGTTHRLLENTLEAIGFKDITYYLDDDITSLSRGKMQLTAFKGRITN